MDKITLKHITSKDNSTISVYEPMPFPIKRVYWMQGMKYDEVRGEHAHHETDQIVICVKGSCLVYIESPFEQEEFTLGKDMDGFVLWNFYWHNLTNFSPDCVLMILASTEFHEEDYIREYKEYTRTVYAGKE